MDNLILITESEESLCEKWPHRMCKNGVGNNSIFA